MTMAMTFDFLADPDEQRRRRERDWMVQATLLRAEAFSHDDLTKLRTNFLKELALENVSNQGHGRARPLLCKDAGGRLGFDTARREPEVALAGFPPGSARLLLHFRLLTPLLTKDDDAFHLFDNPARKDRLTGSPYIAAASLKGLAADAYQRVFPPATPWAALGDDDPSRTRAYRAADRHALRLFGIADDGAKTQVSQAGRLQFSPVWFSRVQYLVMNPGNPKQATGTQPIQFEAIAPDQTAALEVVYFNPAGTKDSDVVTVRADLARFLAALAAWWPVLGLGAKRLGGYGAIAIEKAVLQAVAWPGLEAPETALSGPPAEPERPRYYDDYLEGGEPLSGEALAERVRQRVAELDQRIAELDQLRRKTQGKTQSKANKDWEKAKAARTGVEGQVRGEHRKVKEVWEQIEDWRERLAEYEAALAARRDTGVASREELGSESWLRLARWMAGEEVA